MSMEEQSSPMAAIEFFPVPKVPARLIEYAPGHKVAVPPHTAHSLIENPSVVVVPAAARYGYGLLAWQGLWLPLLDLHALLQADIGVERTVAPRYALVLAYQRAARRPVEYGAIALTTLPTTIFVDDEAQCELPADSMRWPLLALSCFLHEGQTIPILDTTRIFAAYHCPSFNGTGGRIASSM